MRTSRAWYFSLAAVAAVSLLALLLLSPPAREAAQRLAAVPGTRAAGPSATLIASPTTAPSPTATLRATQAATPPPADTATPPSPATAIATTSTATAAPTPISLPTSTPMPAGTRLPSPTPVPTETPAQVGNAAYVNGDQTGPGALATAATGANATPAPCPNGPIRIMPLGDSITYGMGGTDGGYRHRLYTLLTGEGYQVDFVGSQQMGSPDFDGDNEGHPGWYAAGTPHNSLLPFVYDWLSQRPADVILLHIGTNDISAGHASANEVAAVLDEIDRFSPNVWVVLAQIVDRAAHSPETSQYNVDLGAMAEARIANGDRIILVDMEHALSYPDDLADDLHPNNSGYTKMAGVWNQALLGLLPACR